MSMVLGNQALLKHHQEMMKSGKKVKWILGICLVAYCALFITDYPDITFSAFFLLSLVPAVCTFLACMGWTSQMNYEEIIEKIKTENEFRYLAFNGSAAEVCETADNWDFWHKRENAKICGIYVWKVIKMVRYPWFAGVFVSAMIKCVPQELIKDENRESLLDCVAKGLVNYSDEAVIDSFLAGIRAKNEKFADAIKEAMKPSKEDAPQAA